MSGTISSGIVCFLFLFVLTGIPVNGYDNSGLYAKHSAQRAEKCMGLNSHLRAPSQPPYLPHRSRPFRPSGRTERASRAHRTAPRRSAPAHCRALPRLPRWLSTGPSVCADRRRQAENGTAAPPSRNARMLPQAGGLPRRSRPDSRRALVPEGYSTQQSTARYRGG